MQNHLSISQPQKTHSSNPQDAKSRAEYSQSNQIAKPAGLQVFVVVWNTYMKLFWISGRGGSNALRAVKFSERRSEPIQLLTGWASMHFSSLLIRNCS